MERANDVRFPEKTVFLVKQVTLSFIINFLFGAIFSAPVFTVAISDASVPKHSLEHVWPFGIALSGPLTAILMIPLSVYFSGAASKTKTARMLSSISAVALLCVSVAGLGVSFSIPILIFVGGVMLAVPTAASTVFNMQHIAELLPTNFGVAVGACNVAIGLGIVVTSWFGDFLLSYFSTANSLFIFATTLALLAFLPAFSVQFPHEAAHLEGCEQESQGESETLLVHNERPVTFMKLTWVDAVRNRSVWLFVLCIACKRVAFPILPYFFEIGSTYGASTSTLAKWVEASAVLSVVFNLVTSAASDYFRFASGRFQSGARNVLLLVMLMQIIALGTLIQSTPSNTGFVAWAVAAVCLRLTLQAHFSMAMTLANDFFGPQNMALLTGFAGGIAIGFGEFAASTLIAVTVAHSYEVDGPAKYFAFYRVALFVSFISVIFLCCIRKQVSTSM